MPKEDNRKNSVIAVIVIVIILGFISLMWGYDAKEYDAYLVPGGTLSGNIDTNTKEQINYNTVWYYKKDIRYDTKIGEYTTEITLRRLIRNISDIKIDETYQQTKIIEHQNVFGSVVKVNLIIGRDIEMKEKNEITTQR